jgi:hypothetical protein
MKDLWGDSSSIKRTRYNILVKTTLIILLASIVLPTFYFNWNNIKAWAKDLFTKPTIQQSFDYTPIGNETFDDVFSRVHELEVLAKRYKPTERSRLTLNYIRTSKYNSGIWGTFNAISPLDENFVKFVKENEGEHNITSFRPATEGGAATDLYFTAPSTSDYVDFYHLFATMESISTNKQSIADVGGWAGDLVELIYTFKDSTDTGDTLKTTIQTAFNGAATYGFGETDVCADFDAVNIMEIYKSSTNKSIATCASNYYKTLTKEKRIEAFRESTFPGVSDADLQSTIKTRLTGNTYIMMLASSFGISLASCENVVNACVEVFAEYIY